jgi:teichuronic acid biosynthesis glycosyltransferase TuaH
MHNFVIFSLSRWNIDMGTNIRDISRELSRSHKVLYIDVPLKRKERWLMRNHAAVKEVDSRLHNRENLKQLSENLWHYIGDEMLESVNGISNNFIFDIVNKINNRRFAKVIKKATKEAGFMDYILINDNDIYNGYYLGKLLKPSMYMYYLRDRLPAMAYWKVQTGRLEPTLIAGVDVITANSQYLADYAKSINSHSYYVGQGCDVSHFLSAPPVEKVEKAREGLAGRVIGYIGALNSERLDIRLLSELALNMKEFNFVLVGQEDNGFMQSSLHSVPNVTFVGKKEFSELPEILYGFDVAINPQVVNEITVGNYPRKVDEYLAAGKPVVATATEAMKPFSAHVYLATDAKSYESSIRMAIGENSPEKELARKVFASGHTWTNSVNEMMKAIDVVINEKQS